MSKEKNIESYVTDIMMLSSDKYLEGKEKSIIKKEVIEYRNKEIPSVVDIDTIMYIESAFILVDRLKEEKCSDKKIKRVMVSPVKAMSKLQYVNLIKSFISEVRLLAYEEKNKNEIEKILGEDERFAGIISSKDKNIVSLRKSIPKLIKVVREMKAKDKTPEEIQAFMEKHLSSFIKLS